jgi:hypothetical protein
MDLVYDNWITELEDRIASHIDAYISTDVQILGEGELPRAFTKPVITLAQFDGSRRNTCGMNTVGGGEQGYWQMPSYYITVNTDDGDYDENGKLGRNKVAAEIEIRAFGSQKHNLATATGGALKIDLQPIGPVLGGGPTADRRIYQYVFILELELIIPFTSLVL